MSTPVQAGRVTGCKVDTDVSKLDSGRAVSEVGERAGPDVRVRRDVQQRLDRKQPAGVAGGGAGQASSTMRAASA